MEFIITSNVRNLIFGVPLLESVEDKDRII